MSTTIAAKQNKLAIGAKKSSQMKAVVIHGFGDFDVMRYEEVARPTPNPGSILIKVLAAGVNRLDHYIRQGSVVPELPFPHILGLEASGEVAELGEGVKGFKLGERVIPVPGFPIEEGDYDIYPARIQHPVLHFLAWVFRGLTRNMLRYPHAGWSRMIPGWSLRM